MIKKRKYEPEFKNKIIRLHLEEGRTLMSLAQEYKVNKASISNWVKSYREECQVNHYIKEEVYKKLPQGVWTSMAHT